MRTLLCPVGIVGLLALLGCCPEQRVQRPADLPPPPEGTEVPNLETAQRSLELARRHRQHAEEVEGEAARAQALRHADARYAHALAHLQALQARDALSQPELIATARSERAAVRAEMR